MPALIETWNPEEMRRRLQLDEDVLLQIVQLFWDDLPLRRESLVSAVAGGRRDEVLRLAHTLKGTAANLVAHGVVRAAEELERSAEFNDFAGIGRNHLAVLREIDLLLDSLSEFLR